MCVMLFVAQAVGNGERGMLWLSPVVWKIAQAASEGGPGCWLCTCVWLQFIVGETWLHLVGLDLNDHFMENNINGGELVLMALLLHRHSSLPSAVPKGLLSYPR